MEDTDRLGIEQFIKSSIQRVASHRLQSNLLRSDSVSSIHIWCVNVARQQRKKWGGAEFFDIRLKLPFYVAFRLSKYYV